MFEEKCDPAEHHCQWCDWPVSSHDEGCYPLWLAANLYGRTYVMVAFEAARNVEYYGRDYL